MQGPYADAKSTKMSSSKGPQVYISSAMELQASLDTSTNAFNKFKRETLDDVKKMPLPTAEARSCRAELAARGIAA